MNSLNQPEYVHVLLNHLPLTGLAVAMIALLGGLMARSRAAMFIGLGLVALTSASAWPVAVYGQKGYDRVLAMADDDGRIALERHAKLGERWVKLYEATALAACAGLVAGWKQPGTLRWICGVLLLLSLACVIQGGRIAEEGGKIRHREFRL